MIAMDMGQRDHHDRMALRIGFVLVSPTQQPQPSTRISVLNVLPRLGDAGFQASILHEPATDSPMPDLDMVDPAHVAASYDIVYFQKVHGPSVLRLAAALRGAGVPTVYGACDSIERSMIEATDATILVTEFLRSLQPPALRYKIHVVHDGIENPAEFKRDHAPHRGSRMHPLRAVLVSSSALTRLPVLKSPPPWLHVRIVGRYPPRTDPLQRLREVRWQLAHQSWSEKVDQLSFLMDRRIQRLPWHPVDVYRQLLQADIGIIPVDRQEVVDDPTPLWMLKSENRLTLKMAAGLPVVATPIPSYEELVDQGVNALFARTSEEWLRQLEALRDPELRREMGESARRSVLSRYSQTEQLRRLVEVLHRLPIKRGVASAAN